MLVYYYGHVNGTLELVANAIAAAEGQVTAWARWAYRKGEELRTRIDPGAFVRAKEIDIVLGRPTARSGSVLIPMDWKGTGVGALFPVMRGDLLLQPLGHEFVQVVFRGSYEPPLGTPRRLLDRAVLHRVAEASAKAFLDQLCRAIDDAVVSDREQDPNGGTAARSAVEGRVTAGLFSPVAQAC